MIVLCESLWLLFFTIAHKLFRINKNPMIHGTPISTKMWLGCLKPHHSHVHARFTQMLD